jgi:tRNA-Thr(GGU) m(6)t(6)A37 methyltransferase TsaA
MGTKQNNISDNTISNSPLADGGFLPIILNPIGIIHTPFTEINNMPIQPLAAAGVKGYIELYPEYLDGLKDIEGFSHITLLYHFHKINGFELTVTPFMDTNEHGIFATRSPKRPNAIGISTVKLIGIEGNKLYLEETDMLDGSPLIDIKPFYPRFDNRDNCRIGWLQKSELAKAEELRSDERFK